MNKWKVIHGNCLEILPSIPDESIDAVITDPPYPHIKRSYGELTSEEWWSLVVDGAVPEIRRVLKPTGSAVFILQPNAERVGQMRSWLWEFVAWVCREWNLIQDAYWWNITSLPTAHAIHGFMRSSVRHLVWCGALDCYKDQEKVLWEESERSKAVAKHRRFKNENKYKPSGASTNRGRMTAATLRRGGVTPFNLLPIPNCNSSLSSGTLGHGAGTPLPLADWWSRYICPPGGAILDPFNGAGTMGVAAVNNGCDYIGIEKESRFVDASRCRISEALAKMDQ